MEIIKFVKNLGSAEDLLLDATSPSQVDQSRAGQVVQVTKINAASIPYAGKPGQAGYQSIKEVLDSKVGFLTDVKITNDNGGLGFTVGNADATWNDGEPATTEGTIFQKLTSGSYRWLMKMTLGENNVLFKGRVAGADSVNDSDYITQKQVVDGYLGKTAQATDSAKLEGEGKTYFAKNAGDNTVNFKVKTPVSDDDAVDKLYVDETLALSTSVIIISHKTDPSIGGGSLTAGAWFKRDMNTVEKNTIIGASLVDGQLTLPPGDYEVEGFANGNYCHEHVARIQNISDSTTDIIGSSAVVYSGQTSISAIIGALSIVAEKVFEVQHRGTYSATDGMGSPNSFIDNIYAKLVIRKVSNI